MHDNSKIIFIQEDSNISLIMNKSYCIHINTISIKCSEMLVLKWVLRDEVSKEIF